MSQQASAEFGPAWASDVLGVDEIQWELDEPEPTPCHVAEDIGPPSGLTASRADLVIWWRWRYTALEAENARMADLLVQALGEAQGYRQVLHEALDALYTQGHRHDRLREQHSRLRNEYRSHRERATRRRSPGGPGVVA